MKFTEIKDVTSLLGLEGFEINWSARSSAHAITASNEAEGKIAGTLTPMQPSALLHSIWRARTMDEQRQKLAEDYLRKTGDYGLVPLKNSDDRELIGLRYIPELKKRMGRDITEAEWESMSIR